MSFTFSFSGDDIEDDGSPNPPPSSPHTLAPAMSAFPIQGQTQLQPTFHTLSSLLATLPSKIAYDILEIEIDVVEITNVKDKSSSLKVRLPRRELWDVRAQLMAEDDGNGGGDDNDSNGRTEGLGKSDVKTGVYEGGFKSWESSVDLVKVLLSGRLGGLVSGTAGSNNGLRVVELGCGTALPSLALFQQALARAPSVRGPLTLVLADYNSSVLQLATLPNLILTWALHIRRQSAVPAALQDAFSLDGELELLPEVIAAFTAHLDAQQISLLFYSGGWSSEFADMVGAGLSGHGHGNLVLLGAETIYSPLALRAFTDTVFRLLKDEQQRSGGSGAAGCLVAAKRLYFGVGGSLNDFVDLARSMSAQVTGLREEDVGVRRGVVQIALNA